MAEPQHSDEELRAASKHLGYEVDMFLEAAAELQRMKEHPTWATTYASTESGFVPEEAADTATWNALLESFLIHARVLFDFLYASDPRRDDVTAEHYAAGWEGKRPGASQNLLELKRRVNKEVAHISYVRLERPTEAEKHWEFAQIAKEMCQLLLAFLANAKPSCLDEQWDARRQRLDSFYSS